MRLARIAHPEGMSFAVLDGPPGDVSAREVADHPFGVPTFTGRRWPLADVRLLAPILPSKVIGVGRNYFDAAAAPAGQVPDEPTLFLKPATSVIGPGVPIVWPAASKRVDYEGELAVVIGRPCHWVRAADAASVILGYTAANDVTARDLRTANSPWLRSKAYDTFCPLGPWIETEFDPLEVDVTTTVGDEVHQAGNTRDLIFPISELIEACSQVMTLLPGDVILTGTPAGIGPLTVGVDVTVSVAGIGELRNPVVAEAADARS